MRVATGSVIVVLVVMQGIINALLLLGKMCIGLVILLLEVFCDELLFILPALKPLTDGLEFFCDGA